MPNKDIFEKTGIMSVINKPVTSCLTLLKSLNLFYLKNYQTMIPEIYLISY